MTKFFDRVYEETTGTGTGNLALGGTTTGFVAFTSAHAADAHFPTAIVASNGDWEVSYCKVSTPNLIRVAPIASSNANALVNFGAGTKQVFGVVSAWKSTLWALQNFGDGSDGDVTLNSGTTQLTSLMSYRNLTLNGGFLVVDMWSPIRISGVLDLTAATIGSITQNGTDAASGASGSGSLTATGTNPFARPFGPDTRRVNHSQDGSSGAGSTIGVQTGNDKIYLGGTVTGVGGKGGDGSSGTGGSGGFYRYTYSASSESTSRQAVPRSPNVFHRFTPQSQVVVSSSGAGGGSGGGDGSNPGGGSGNGGIGGGYLVIGAAVINRSTTTASGAIQVIGGQGGNGSYSAAGNTGGGGAGSGGGGGYCNIVAGALIGTAKPSCINASGGLGGTGGTGFGTGTGGHGGSGGDAGVIHVWDLALGTCTETTGTVGLAGSAPSGTTGGAGGAGGPCWATL